MSIRFGQLKKILLVALTCLIFSISTITISDPLEHASEIEIIIEARDQTEMVVSHYPADGDTLIIWVGSSYNFSKRAYRTAHQLAKNNLEVWQIDFAEVLFEPKTSNFMRNLDAQYVADLISAAHNKTGKKIILLARAYGAIPVMRGATLWQRQNPEEKYLSGAILFSPDFFKAIPELGLDPEYLPITNHTTIPTFIFQGGRRGTAWQFPRLLKIMTESNQHIYYKYMPGVAGVFYRNDSDPAATEMLQRLPSFIPDVVHLLQSSPDFSPPEKYQQNKNVQHQTLLNSKIKAFKGNSIPPPFTLLDSDKKTIVMDNFKDKVTVVNFWATWCPPCVEEIPSLNRLRQKMNGKPFELISINYAESSQTIDQFLKQINVEFPVLLDKDGSVSTKWNVVAFPSTFIIGPDGKIHYGINAAIRWDADEVITLLNSLY